MTFVRRPVPSIVPIPNACTMASLSLCALLLFMIPFTTGATVTVNVNTTFQTMDGFGFSQAFGRANDVKNSPAAQAKATLDLLFNQTTGAGMSILRNRIGSGGVGDSIEPVGPSSPSGTPAYTWDGDDSWVVFFT